MSRFPLFNAELQTDLDAMGFSIKNLGASSALQSGTIYVDPNVPIENGQIDSSMPFKSLQAALAAAPPGYSIYMRPAVYSWDGYVVVPRAGIKIFGYGATIRPTTANGSAGLSVTASDVFLFGLNFDAGAGPGAVNVDTGAVFVQGLRVFMKDLTIVNQAGVGIALDSRFAGSTIDNCRIQTSYRGVTGTLAGTGISNTEVTIRNSFIENNRAEGVKIDGDANVTVLGDIEIYNTRIVANGTSTQAGVTISGARDILISDSYFAGQQYDGVVLTKVKRATISGNTFIGHAHYNITVTGHLVLKIADNIIDGSNPQTGAALSVRGISIDGDYATANDSGPCEIVGNTIVGIANNGHAMNIAHANNVSIDANTATGLGTFYFTGLTNLRLKGNTTAITSNSLPITIDAGDRGTASVTIIGNELNTSGAPTRLIGTTDAGGLGQTNFKIIGNSAKIGATYSSGIFSNVAGVAPTNVYIQANTPPSTTADNRNGWVNDEILVAGTIFVSQSRGINGQAVVYHRDHPFQTIAGAITAAVSGDTIRVLDGTFNEKISAKNGVTVRFDPPAVLVCSTSNGCVASSATNALFTLYHQHTPILCTQAGTTAISTTHVGSYIKIFGGINHSGAGSGSIAIGGPDGTVETLGDVYSVNDCAIKNTAGGSNTFFCIVHGEGNNLWTVRSDVAVAIDLGAGIVKVINGKILGGTAAISLRPAVSQHVYKNCTITAAATASPAIAFGTNSAVSIPTFWNCVFVSGATATSTMSSAAAQSVRLYGSNVANKGANPPTNVTFIGGGTYAVDAGVTGEF